MLHDLRCLLGYSELDEKIWREELADFVPPRLFDAHVHLFSREHSGMNDSASEWCRYETDLQRIKGIYDLLLPEKKTDCLVFALPLVGADNHKFNEWVAGEARRQPDCRCAMVVTPQMKTEQVMESVRAGGFCALKPYHHYSEPREKDISGYFPECLMEVANELACPVILHTRQSVSCYMDELEDYARRYPRIKWVLAHCGASFHPFALEECIDRLREIPNIWYDNALICEMDTLAILLKYENRKRVMFGTDSALVIGGCRKGRVLSYGRSALWYKDPCNTTFWMYEQLRIMKRCCKILELSEEEINGLFFANASDLYCRQDGASNE